MGLQISKTIKDVAYSTCYVMVSTIHLQDKLTMFVTAKFYPTQAVRQDSIDNELMTERYALAHDPATESNIITQSYTLMKAMGEFAGASDV